MSLAKFYKLKAIYNGYTNYLDILEYEAYGVLDKIYKNLLYNEIKNIIIIRNITYYEKNQYKYIYNDFPIIMNNKRVNNIINKIKLNDNEYLQLNNDENLFQEFTIGIILRKTLLN